MNKTISIIITIVLIIAIGILFFGHLENNATSNRRKLTDNVKIKNKVQYITINVHGGYSPRISSARANLPTKLIMKTNATYDCSLALVIKEIGYQKILSNTGEEVIDLGIPKTGSLQGLCSMGMYNFMINFN